MADISGYERFSLPEFWGTLSSTFVSFYFIAFVLVLVLVYYLVPRRLRWYVLLAGSVLFYGTAGLHPLITVLLTAFLVYLFGILIESVERKDRKKRRVFLFSGITIVLGVLVFVKCYSFLELPFRYTVPLGISYYTFSAVSYLADIYWGKDKAERNYLKLTLFLLFFPKILQGPISRHNFLGEQLTEGHDFDYKKFCFGVQLAMYGYFKKIVIADRIALFTSAVFADDTGLGGAVIAFTVVLSAVQLYCDFSGCMDIAAGISEMFGITIEKNFDHPFFSKTGAEFWRRWHITLGMWVRDYIYMPLAISPRLIRLSGKARKKIGKRFGRSLMTVIPLAAAWIFTGLWHGTGLNYLVWGIYWGSIMIIGSVFAPEWKKLTKLLHIDPEAGWWKRVQIVRTFALFCVARMITIPDKLSTTLDWLGRIFTKPKIWQLFDNSTLFSRGLDWHEFYLMLIFIGILWFCSLKERSGSIREKIAGWHLIPSSVFYAFSMIGILIFGIYGPAYGVSTFVYMNF